MKDQLIEAFIGEEDRRLLSQTLTTTDPEEATDRVRLPKLNPGPPIILKYDVTPPGNLLNRRPYVWCGHCGKPTHWKGYIVELEDGVRVNLGGVCGVKHFGFAYGAIENTFEAQVDRQRLVPQLVRLRLALPVLADAVVALLSAPATKEVDQLYEDFKGRWPRLWRSLYSFVSAGRVQLVTARDIPDVEGVEQTKANIRVRFQQEMATAQTKTAREKARLAMKRALGEVGERYRLETTTHGILVGGAFLTRQHGVGPILGRISSDIRDLRATLDVPNSDILSTEAMKTALQTARELLHRADAGSDLFGEASEFWSTRNLSGIASWANAENLGVGSGYQAGARQLTLGATTLGVASSFVEPDEVFSEFRRTMRWPERSFDSMPMSRRFRAAG